MSSLGDPLKKVMAGILEAKGKMAGARAGAGTTGVKQCGNSVEHIGVVSSTAS